MESFNENLTPEQIKMLTLQFMGQHLTGDLKNLEQNIVAKNNTLQGMVLNPAAVINSIPSTPAIQQVAAPQLTVHQEVPQYINTPIADPVPTVQSVITQQPIVDQNQLEFSFETSPLSERIFDTLQRIEKKLSLIEERICEIEDIKKKD
jgi:hypothetical protein